MGEMQAGGWAIGCGLGVGRDALRGQQSEMDGAPSGVHLAGDCAELGVWVVLWLAAGERE